MVEAGLWRPATVCELEAASVRQQEELEELEEEEEEEGIEAGTVREEEEELEAGGVLERWEVDSCGPGLAGLRGEGTLL